MESSSKWYKESRRKKGTQTNLVDFRPISIMNIFWNISNEMIEFTSSRITNYEPKLDKIPYLFSKFTKFLLSNWK